ncbi:MAG TPA: phosphatase PAP2 family protein [Anaerolineae bacterium]|nr:phosphatase PAP2 family protein [Anaerolineae bacterium]
MNAWMDWGIEVILWLQQFRPALDVPFEIITATGDEPFLMLLLPVLYWCLDRKLGARMLILFLISTCANMGAKLAADQPRPRLYDSRVWAYSDVGGTGGFPSNHTQNSVILWGYLGAQLRRRWLWVLGGALMLLTPLSRLYLGVHFPHDLFGGYLLGALLLGAYLIWEPGLEKDWEKLKLTWRLGIITTAAILLALLLPTEEGVAAAAVLWGGGSGFVLERRWVGFESAGTWQQRALRLFLGHAVLLGIRFGLRAAFEGLEPLLVFRFIRYTLIGFWAGMGAPWAFVKAGLATKAHP